MGHTIFKEYVTCKICHNDLSSNTNFNKHLASHFNPLSRLCHTWYKDYFKNDRGVCVCKECDEEMHPETPTSSYEYAEHLKKHGITRGDD